MSSLVDLEQAFWSKVWRCAHQWPCKICCWPWGRQRVPGAFPQLPPWVKGNPSRFAMMLDHGALLLPASRLSFVVCHRCDYHRCCNPAHLWIGTQGDNIRDARDKGFLLVQRHRRYVTLPDGSQLALFERVADQLQPGWGTYLRRMRASTRARKRQSSQY